MFKRIEKRRRKQEKEEELGLTEEMKEVLGMHDTDSEESDSTSDNASSAGPSDDERVSAPDIVHNSSEGEENQSESGSDEEDGDEDYLPGELPRMSVTEAMKDPVYIISVDPDIRSCSVCPGKLLKNITMAEVHKASKAHYRRFSRFVEFAGDADPDTDISEFWQMLNSKTASAPKDGRKDGKALSKRAERRKAKLAALKAKRKKAKELKAKGIKFKAEKKEKAKKLATAIGASTHESKSDAEADKLKQTTPSKPPKKKRKVETDITKRTQAQASSPSASKDVQPPKSDTNTSIPQNNPGATKPAKRKREAKEPSKDAPAAQAEPPSGSPKTGKPQKLKTDPSKDSKSSKPSSTTMSISVDDEHRPMRKQNPTKSKSGSIGKKEKVPKKNHIVAAAA